MTKQPTEKAKYFRIDYSQTEYRSCNVWAESEREARKLFKLGASENDRFMDADNQRIIDVEEEER